MEVRSRVLETGAPTTAKNGKETGKEPSRLSPSLSFYFHSRGSVTSLSSCSPYRRPVSPFLLRRIILPVISRECSLACLAPSGPSVWFFLMLSLGLFGCLLLTTSRARPVSASSQFQSRRKATAETVAKKLNGHKHHNFHLA